MRFNIRDRFLLVATASALLVEMGVFISHNPYPHGDIVDVRYRQKERLEAVWNNRLHPSPDTRVRLDSELARMRKYEWVIFSLQGSALLVINVIGLRYLVKREGRTG